MPSIRLLIPPRTAIVNLIFDNNQVYLAADHPCPSYGCTLESLADPDHRLDKNNLARTHSVNRQMTYHDQAFSLFCSPANRLPQIRPNLAY
jgi:hypothetical protein